MHIVFYAWRDLAHPNAGGSEVVVDTLARQLQARGHDFTLACGGPVADRSYPVVDLGSTYTQYIKAPLAHRRGLHEADLAVDVVNGMPYFTPLWRKGPSLALVHHVHDEQWGHYFSPPVAKVGRFLECDVMPRVYRRQRFLTISASSRDSLVGIGIHRERIHVMHNGLDADAFDADGEKAAEPTFLALARLAPNKRVDLLLDAWERVRPITGGTLVIAGDGPDLASLQAQAGADVVFVGRVDEPTKRRLLREAWVLVHPALQEGWGLVIMEAAAQETPAIGFDVVGVRDTIVDGLTGELATTVDQFVDRWIALTSDHARRAALGEHAQLRAREFTWDAAVDTFEKAAEAAIQDSEAPAPVVRKATWRRSQKLFSLFRNEQTDPDTFYTYLANDTVEHLASVIDLAGARCADVGGGPGYTAEALSAAGASCIVVEYAFEELLLHERQPDVAVQGDGCALPLATGSVDLCHSSNVLEHVPDPWAMLSEMSRVLRPDHGVGYMTFTNWYSPWGGHETSPYHYLGGHRAARRFEARNGHAPKNKFGESLHALHIAEVRRWFAARPDVEVLWMGPRYLPDQLRWISSVPALREVITWNLAVMFRRRSDAL